MNLEIKKSFLEKWEKHFPGSELPIVCHYTDEMDGAKFPNKPKPNPRGYTCIFSKLAPVRKGRARAFNTENLGCWGASITLGFQEIIIDAARDFLINVERYKKTGDLVDKMYEDYPPIQAQGRYIVFKRWDELVERDEPQVVFFFGNPDIIAGLFALANFDTMTPHGVIVPFGSGCDSIVGFPMRELESKQPKAVLGGLDPSVRICVKPHILTFSAPWPKFMSMLENMDDSFLIADTWRDVKSRFKPKQ